LIIKYKILTKAATITVNPMLMLYRKVLYNYGDLPSEIVMIVMRHMIY